MRKHEIRALPPKDPRASFTETFKATAAYSIHHEVLIPCPDENPKNGGKGEDSRPGGGYDVLERVRTRHFVDSTYGKQVLQCKGQEMVAGRRYKVEEWAGESDSKGLISLTTLRKRSEYPEVLYSS